MPASKTWIAGTLFKRECVKFIPASRDAHRCSSVCQVCQNLIRCCCGRLIGDHSAFTPRTLSLTQAELTQDAGEWSVELHTKTSPTDAFGSIDFQDSAKRSCRAKYVRLSCDTRTEQLVHLMLREWQMELPKLVISVHGGAENFTLPPKVSQAFCKGLIRAAESTGAWIFTDGINTGASRYVGEAMKEYGTHDLRKRNTLGITPWGAIENHTDLIGKDVLRPYQTVGNPLSKRACLNGFHSHFLLVDDGTLGKNGGQLDLRKRLERHIRSQKIHPRLCQGVPVVCVVVEGGPGVLSLVLEYVKSSPPVPVVVFEGTGRAADLLAFVHKQTAGDRQMDRDIKDDLLLRIQDMFSMGKREASELYSLLMDCMDHRDAVTIFDCDSEDQPDADVAILTASLKGMKATALEQLSIALAWDRADVAKKHILVYGQHWQVGSLEQAMLDALVMDRVSFVKLLIENGMTMTRFLTVSRLEELYNTHQGPTDTFLHHLIEDVKKHVLPAGYRISLIDVGLLIEYLIGGAYRSSYTRKNFRAVYSRLCAQGNTPESSGHFARQRGGFSSTGHSAKTPLRPHFFRTAQPYKHKEKSDTPSEPKMGPSTELSEPALYVYNFNDLFVWAVLKRRQQMALFLWQHGEEAMARAVVACKLYRAMANEARESNMADSLADQLKTYSLEFGQLAVGLLDKAFRENERMAMKLLTSEMKDWSHFTCLQMAVSSGLRSFVAHSCTQMLLTDLWVGRLNMRKNSWFKIILCILVPVSIQLLEFKSQAEMSHVPQSQEALHFGLDSRGLDANESQGTAKAGYDAEKASERRECSSDLFSQWIQWLRKLYDFYNAPVVKFWFHTMSYLAFLMLFSYTVLVRMEDHPSPQEWLVIAYIIATAVEKAREVLMSEPRKLSKKLKVWFSEYWNVSDFVAISLFLVGLALRWDSSWRAAGHIIYCLDVIFWFVRVLDLLAVNQHAGPYLTMITKMTSNMFFIVIMMAIVILSFGVSRKAILSPDEDPSWTLAKDVVFQPYWMIFGEVYAGEIDSCANSTATCVPGAFITPFLQAVYLFFQYIIMVNILIAFFNNVYFDMKSISNQLWQYHRYRYIMTYQEKPWLPPPLILLSHMTLYVRKVCRKSLGASEQEQDSGLKLFLASDDLKKLHEFEGRCVTGYFFEKNENLHSSQINRICYTAEKSGEMTIMLGEVTEKVHFIQDSLQTLDSQLGHLQDTSAMAVDTLSLLAASDDYQQRAALYGLHRPISSSHLEVLHSWCLPRGDSVPPQPSVLAQRPYSSHPSSLLGSLCLGQQSLPLGWQHQRSSEDNEKDSGEEQWKSKPCPVHPRSLNDALSSGCCQLSHDSLPHVVGWTCGPSRSSIPLVPWSSEAADQHQQPRAWHHDSHLPPSQEESADEIEEEEEDQEEELSNSAEMSLSRTSSHAVLLSDSPVDRGRHMGLVNLGFSGDDELALPQCKQRCRTFPRWKFSQHSRSLSASVENVAFLGALPVSLPPLALAGDSPSVDHVSHTGKDTPTSPLTQNRELSKSADLTESLEGKKRVCGRKTVKIQEENSEHVRELYSHTSDCYKRGRCHGRFPALRKCSTSASLSQLSFDHVDLMQRFAQSFQDTRSPSQSLWSSWARSNSRRSSIQSGAISEVRGATFQSTEDLHPHYSAMERNNLMRLAHTIPFTPVSLMAGEEVSVYTLEETESDGGGTGSRALSMSSWSPRGRSAILQSLSHEGVLDGGLRRAWRVVCTWAEEGVLKPGCVYVVKAFRPEVVRMWQRAFHSDTSLHLCLRMQKTWKLLVIPNQLEIRAAVAANSEKVVVWTTPRVCKDPKHDVQSVRSQEIQQQRAAQKLMYIFNQLKPQSMRYSPRFLDVSLVHWHGDDQWLTIERNMAGDFRKYNNNTGEEIASCCGLEDTVLAFSHWTYEYSCYELLVLDLQGVGLELTDPSVIRVDDDQSTSGDMVFGPANLGSDAIQSFIRKHNCNSSCEKLGLSDLRRRPSKGSGAEASEEESDTIVTRM